MQLSFSPNLRPSPPNRSCAFRPERISRRSNCVPPLFADGFESADTGAWSVAVP